MKYVLYLVTRLGVEPRTYGLRVRYLVLWALQEGSGALLKGGSEREKLWFVRRESLVLPEVAP